MSKKQCGAEEARTILPELLERAHHGSSTVITKRGKPYAAVVPVSQALAGKTARMSLLTLAASGRGLWGKKSATTVKRLRDEWS